MTAITEEWLRDAGFRWSQFDRQPDKHWTLWLGWAMDDGPDIEDVGIEVAPNRDGRWFCWLRADTAGRYTRFVHIRHLRWQRELTELIAAIAGRPFDPADVFYGGLVTAARAERYRGEAERMDRQMLNEHYWSTDGTDHALGRATAEHLPREQRGVQS
ncbi:hypothetical protein KZ810_13230 [Sphingomonas sp. RHCKR47]|uniref:hypothetical protein n=1 Tax=Sphingomonas citricola TaxID=2862498 RepID=UPI001CA4A054|nr:hypothetical protein [Sphingomonas citricola]MBW6524465.1 hypothetical protein [Sphingomonas citricola]